MSITPFEQSIFNHFPLNGVCIQTETAKKSIASVFFTCQNCMEPVSNSSYIFQQQTISFVPHIKFVCSQCSFQWVICCLCDCINQPQLLSETIIQRNRHRMNEYLTNIIETHTSTNHLDHSIGMG